MTLRSRLQRLEKQTAGDGHCPACRDRPWCIAWRQDRPDAAPIRAPGCTDDGLPCPQCGWQPQQIVEVVIHNRDELAIWNAKHSVETMTDAELEAIIGIDNPTDDQLHALVQEQAKGTAAGQT